MNFGQLIRGIVNEKGLRFNWVADRIGMNEKTLSGKLNRDSFSNEELMRLSALLNIDLNEIRDSKYGEYKQK